MTNTELAQRLRKRLLRFHDLPACPELDEVCEAVADTVADQVDGDAAADRFVRSAAVHIHAEVLGL